MPKLNPAKKKKKRTRTEPIMWKPTKSDLSEDDLKLLKKSTKGMKCRKRSLWFQNKKYAASGNND